MAEVWQFAMESRSNIQEVRKLSGHGPRRAFLDVNFFLLLEVDHRNQARIASQVCESFRSSSLRVDANTIQHASPTMALQLLRAQSAFSARTLTRSSKSFVPICQRCLNSTASAPPPLQSRLKEDLKAAMRAKDKNRLSVIRSIIADITNAQHTPSPIDSDIKILSLIKKKIAASAQASAEFQAAKREDLVAKETDQVAVLAEYAGSVKVLSEEEVREQVKKMIEEIGAAVKMPDIMKRSFGPGGVFDGKPVDKGMVAKVAKELIPQ
jgi:uncharacterized protein